MIKKVSYAFSCLALVAMLGAGLAGCTSTVTTSVTATKNYTSTQSVTATATQSVTATKSVTATATQSITSTQVVITTQSITTTAYPFAPIVVDTVNKEVSFNATMKKSEAANQDPTALSTSGPASLINENTGTALASAAMQADPGVNAEKLYNALVAIGLAAGQNVHVGDSGKTAAGAALKVYIEINGKRTLLDDILKSAMAVPKLNYVFLGSYLDQQQLGCGCLICGRSGPGTVVANAGYANSGEPFIGGATMYQGLVNQGLKIGDKVKIVIKGA
jgi:hypothetical protein